MSEHKQGGVYLAEGWPGNSMSNPRECERHPLRGPVHEGKPSGTESQNSSKVRTFTQGGQPWDVETQVE